VRDVSSNMGLGKTYHFQNGTGKSKFRAGEELRCNKFFAAYRCSNSVGPNQPTIVENSIQRTYEDPYKVCKQEWIPPLSMELQLTTLFPSLVYRVPGASKVWGESSP
jgi:hypothetical protein